MASNIVFVDGPRDGDRQRGEWEAGLQILTLSPTDICDCTDVGLSSYELPWHVYVAEEKPGGWRAVYLGRYGARELPRA